MYLPLLLDPVYGYQALNVDAQMRSPSSLLHWTRRMLTVRKEHPVFGMGTYEELEASNPSVLAFCREFGDDKVVCVNNLSRFPQPVELELSRYEGRRLVELTGGVPFPPVGELPYLLSLPGHGFLWFAVQDVS
jgi:maltose alpha-D-glucosyltransferase/alpha-amylase